MLRKIPYYKLLLFVLLIVGCDNSTEPNVDICVLKYGAYNTDCYQDVSEAVCLHKADMDSYRTFFYWGNDYTCAEGCENRKNEADYYTSGGVPENHWDCYKEGVCVLGWDD